jgi:hypothetical protein
MKNVGQIAGADFLLTFSILKRDTEDASEFTLGISAKGINA